MANKNNKRLLLYLSIFILIFVSFLFWFLDFNSSTNQFTYSKLKKILSKKNISLIKKKATKFIDFNFDLVQNENFSIKNKKIIFKKYSNNFIKYRYYLEQDEENIYFITNRGELFYIIKENLFEDKQIELKKIKTNIDNIIGKNYISDANLVVKEILLINQKIYVSYLFNNKDCYSNAILEGNLNTNNIVFKSFFKLDECKKTFNLSKGGNIKKFNNKILLTVGDYEQYENGVNKDPQNINSYYGKILSVDLKSKNIDIISMGHRNPQGLFYDKQNHIIFSTEHGPQGGDEINVNTNPDTNEIENYGWAISSYGEHYGYDNNWSERIKKEPALIDEKYKFAPLNKSHKNYGFIEPIKYFTPSIGITEILKVKHSNKDFHKLIVASMGDNKDEDDMTIHILNFDEKFNMIDHNKIFIGERIRDLIDLGNGHILMSIEYSGSIGLLKNIY